MEREKSGKSTCWLIGACTKPPGALRLQRWRAGQEDQGESPPPRTWPPDGDPATWADYTRKVRLQWEKTPSWKRRHLGPELASRLTGRAWAVTYELSHEKLSKKNGTKYLLRYLQDRLCRTPVPDAGARLEDLLIRLRRPLGMTMSQWSKVQRALVRACKMEPKKDLTKAILDKSTSSKSEPHGEPQGGAGSQGVLTPSVRPGP